MKTIKLFLVALLFTQLSSAASATTSLRNVDNALKAYIAAENAQNYARTYQLLSAPKKQQLRQEFAVKDALAYVKLRQSSEAKWFNFVEKSRQEFNGRVVISLSVVIEENGEQQQAVATLCFVAEGGQWRINEIDYAAAD